MMLDASSNTVLERIRVENNVLTQFSIKNGNNSSITRFIANNNNLSCIEVGDVTFANTNWSNFVDPGTTFEENCP